MTSQEPDVHEWVGNLPATWDVYPLRALMEPQYGKNTGALNQDYLSLMANVGVIPYAQKGDIGNKAPEDLSKCKRVNKGDFVLNSMNFGIGSFGVSSYDGVCSSVYVVLKPKEGKSDPDFLKHIFSMRPFQKHVQSLGNGILEHRAAIGWDDLKNVHFPVPPVRQQKAIAEYLDRETAQIDNLIAKQEQLISKSIELYQARVQRVVALGIDDDAVSIRTGDPWFHEVNSSWNLVPVRIKFQITLGKMLNSGNLENDNDNFFPYLRAANLKENSIDLTDLYQMPFTNTERAKYEIRAGDLLVVEGGAVGVNCVVGETLPNIYFQNALNRVRAQSQLDTEYLGFALDALRFCGALSAMCQGSTIGHLTADKLGNIRIPNPSATEQKMIIETLQGFRDVTAKLISKAEEVVIKLTERRQALISAAVTGKISVGA